MRSVLVAVLILCGVFFIQSQMATRPQAQALYLHQIQVLASHNSYKLAIQPALMKRDSVGFLALDYEHAPLSRQLDLGLRKLEIDIFHDPSGGRYSQPLGNQLLGMGGVSPLPHDTLGLMQSPGFKVLHVQDIDFRSSCLRLQDCLEELKSWSLAHPRHLPVVISFNAKSEPIDQPGFVRPLPFTSSAFDSLDAEILSVIPRERILTPDDLRGDFPTLEAAVLARQWPPLDSVRGKFLFVLDETGEKQANYMEGHPSLKGRVLFVNAPVGTPEAAFLIMNDPIKMQDSIRARVARGYLVRTRADANTWEARNLDYARWEAALSSGAHFISTDYYLPDSARTGTSYQIRLGEGRIAVCNPVTGPISCDAALLSPYRRVE